jgi:hypothetical protein
MGSIVHTFLENYYDSIIKGEFRSVAVEKGIKAATLYSHSEEVRNTNPDEKTWALTTCEAYAEHYKGEHWVPLEVETVKQTLLYEDDEIRIIWKSKIDLLTDTNQGIYSVDHKTMSQRRDTLTLNNQFIGQCHTTQQPRMLVNKVGFQKSLKPEEKFERVLISYSADRLEEWRTEIVPYYARLMLAYDEIGYWPPNFTHCENKYGFCQFKGVCSSERNMREEELRSEFKVGESWDVSNTKENEAQ